MVLIAYGQQVSTHTNDGGLCLEGDGAMLQPRLLSVAS